MSSINLYQIEKSNDDIRKTILTNIIKMLTERKLLKKENLDINIENILKVKSDNLVYIVPLDKYVDENSKNFAIKIVFQKITAINKSFGISDFLVEYKMNPKLIVVKDISKKAQQHILNNYENTEIFLEKELMINIIDHVLVPKHELLSQDEVQLFFEKYNVKKRNIPRILSTDPIARYYNMKPGDICRIIRPSEKSGYVPTYRIVVKGSNNK